MSSESKTWDAAADTADAIPNSAVTEPGRLETWTRQLVFSALEPMRQGCLRMRLPGGGERVFGRIGSSPAAEMVVRREAFFRKGILGGDIGFGEAYQDGDWDSPDVAAVISWFCANVRSAPTMSGSASKPWHLRALSVANRLRHRLNRNSLDGSRSNIRAHYDLGNEFYRLWLDPTMTYSAALFEYPDQDLAAAQDAKYERLCQQLRLRPEDHLLEIGAGWGSMTSHAVRHHGCRVTTVTISEEQFRHCRERFAREGIADRAEVRLLDYRLLEGRFDKIVSIEMLEAVGDEFLETYFARVQSLLKPDGLFAAQFITCPDARYAELRRGADWIQKHIFPGSLLLSMNRVGQAIQRTGPLSLHNLHDIGLDYAATLRHWRARFNARLDEVRRLGFDDRFVRTWNYYLAYCEAAFAWRNISVVQATWTAPNNATLMG
jgi:cyclopropane-fatty-acyl-phospholipid synthase